MKTIYLDYCGMNACKPLEIIGTETDIDEYREWQKQGHSPVTWPAVKVRVTARKPFAPIKHGEIIEVNAYRLCYDGRTKGHPFRVTSAPIDDILAHNPKRTYIGRS